MIGVTPLLDRWRQDLQDTVTALGEDDTAVAPRALGTAPLPAFDHIRRVNSAEKAEPRTFLRSGATDLLAIVSTLAEAIGRAEPRDERDEAGARPAIMELGCGVGRLLRHAPDETRARVVATDVNGESLGWCRANLPGVEYHHHDPAPPIATLPAASIDVIYAHSVFTHIPLEQQQAWLLELRRLLRPGGWLAATFLGTAQKEALLDTAQRDRLAVEGALQIHPERAAGGGAQPIAYGAVCQTVAHQDAILDEIFERHARRERPGRQDVVIVRRR